ncbi:MAG: hypothetical protein MJZ53_02470 [Paludibacteraceae bacterium]|nr:hypothetical protein [Paludibacteraceae bacterium]
MKKISLFSLLAVILLSSCSSIPNKSVFEDLTTDELAKAIKSDDGFGDFYESMHGLIALSTFSEVQKAQYKDVTYRRLYKYINHETDSAKWAPKLEKWGKEWDETLANDLAKVEEKSEYWLNYKAENSLSRFAKVELSSFYITHYSYIGGVDDAYICFNITPTEGTIEQIKFTYSYSYKINNGRGKKSHRCIYSTPITGTREGAWEIDYFEKEDFDGMTVSKFLQNYDLDIEITDVRKDGKNYSLDDLNIPEVITAFWEEDTPETRDEVAKLVNPSYKNRETYISDKKDAEMKEYDELCHSFQTAIKEKSIGNILKGLFD